MVININDSADVDDDVRCQDGLLTLLMMMMMMMTIMMMMIYR